MSGFLSEGTRVRLVGLKNPALLGKLGKINNYSPDGGRVMVLMEESKKVVKVKPKQVEALEQAPPPPGKSSRNRNGSRNDKNGLQTLAIGGRGGKSSSNRSVSTAEGVMETLRSADALFDHADKSGDGVVSQEEFVHYMKRNTDHDVATIRECYLEIDTDNNGDITRDEVRKAFLKKRRETKGDEDNTESQRNFEDNMLAVSRDADKFFDKADADKSGALSRKEFERFMKRTTDHSKDKIHALFDLMDIDHDGVVTKEEVRRAYLNQKKENGGGNTTLQDLLGKEDDDMAELEDDVYNMFFLAEWGSGSFWFALFVWILKLGLIIIIAGDLFTNAGTEMDDEGNPSPDQIPLFPPNEDVPFNVRCAQVLLLPVNVSVQEELITTFYIYANLSYSKKVLDMNQGASRTMYHMSVLMRFTDGLAFLIINTTLLLQATEILGAFLNFAALQFLSDIDNVALQLARDGYLSESLEEIAGDVLLMKLPKNDNEKLQMLDSVMLGLTLVLLVVAFILSVVVF